MEMANRWRKMKMGMADSARNAAQGIRRATTLGTLKAEELALKRRIAGYYTALGERAFELLSGEGQEDIRYDSVAQSTMGDIRKLQEALAELRRKQAAQTKHEEPSQPGGVHREAA